MYILYPQFKYWLSLFYLNLCLLSLLHLPPSISIFLCQPSEIQDCIYHGCSIKAEAKNPFELHPSLIITDYHQSTLTLLTSPIQLWPMWRHDLNREPSYPPWSIQLKLHHWIQQHCIIPPPYFLSWDWFKVKLWKYCCLWLIIVMRWSISVLQMASFRANED